MRYLTFTLLGLSWMTLSCGGAPESEDNFTQENIVKSDNKSYYTNHDNEYSCENAPSEIIEILLQDGSVKKVRVPVFCNSDQIDKGDLVESQSSTSDREDVVMTLNQEDKLSK